MSNLISDPFKDRGSSGLQPLLARGERAAALLVPEPARLERGPNTRIDLRFTAQNGYYAPHLILEGPLAPGSVPLLLGALEELQAGPDGRPRFGLDPRPLGFRSPAFPPSFEMGRDGPLFEVVGVSATTLPRPWSSTRELKGRSGSGPPTSCSPVSRGTGTGVPPGWRHGRRNPDQREDISSSGSFGSSGMPC